MSGNGAYLSPAEAAKRLGVSVKALRVYERHGLINPLRTGADWRAYGPDEMARLHQVLALKRLGLSLARIAELLKGRASTLAAVLALQEQVLTDEESRVTRALELVRSARAKLASGASLTIDDLTTLTKETTMSTKPSPEDMKKIFDPHVEKHFSQSEIAETAKREFDPAYTQKAWDDLIAEAKALMARGEAVDAPATLDVAKRWRGMIQMFTQGNPDVEKRVGQVWQSAFSDPAAAPKLPMGPEVFQFMGQAMNVLKARGE
jgi:DNA-binding transcriptional MerR regulator